MKKQFYVVLTPFFPSPKNFAGSYIYDQVKAIQRLSDFEVIVVAPADSSKAINYVYQGVAVHQVKLLDFPSFVLPGLFNSINCKRILDKLIELTKNQLENIQFIHSHVTYPFGILAVQIAKQIGAKSIVQHHGFDVMGYTNGKLLSSSLRKLNKKWINKNHVPFLNQADWNVGVSQKTLDRLHQIDGYIPTQEFVLYNGVDPAKFYPIDNLKDKNRFTIGCVGNFWGIKDQLTLIKAVALLATEDLSGRLHLKLIGNGATLPSCKNYVAENNLDSLVSFYPAQDHTEMNLFYNSLDLFVLPSYDEAFGCVYTEANACGVPFIGVENQGIEEMIGDEYRQFQLMKAKDIQDLSTKIKYFYNHPEFMPALNHPIWIDELVVKFLNTICKS